VAVCAIPLVRPHLTQTVVERPPFPYVDGLSFLNSPAADFAASGLTAFIADVSSVERLKTEEGSVKYFRSFEACARSLTAARRTRAARCLARSTPRGAARSTRRGRSKGLPTSLDVLKISRKPVVVSHGAARALVNNARCTPDEVITGVADSAGVMGVFMMSFWLTTDPTPTADSYVRQSTFQSPVDQEQAAHIVQFRNDGVGGGVRGGALCPSLGSRHPVQLCDRRVVAHDSALRENKTTPHWHRWRGFTYWQMPQSLRSSGSPAGK